LNDHQQTDVYGIQMVEPATLDAKHRCNVCSKTLEEVGVLHRQNEKGVAPIWACMEHNRISIDPEVHEITNIIREG
jgi:hypothetical protein